MSNLIITNNESRKVWFWQPDYQKLSVTFGGAETWLEGTILAYNSTTDKIVPFVKGGANGEEIPKYILPEALTSTGAGDVPCSVLISGKVRKDKLVIKADGDASNVDQVVRDQLRDFTMVAHDTTQLGEQDNQ